MMAWQVDERMAPISAMNDEPWRYCETSCAYGDCGGSPWPGCGGCCWCLGGCQVEYENHHFAPFLWEGDPA